jgi:hypothetical protein
MTELELLKALENMGAESLSPDKYLALLDIIQTLIKNRNING